MKSRDKAIQQGRMKNKFLYAPIVFVATGFAATAIAAEGIKGIEEVVVTAQQREQNLQEVPISISAFTSEAIEKNMFSDVTEYITRTPNASFITNGAKSRRRISIRGITNSLPDSDAIRTSTFGFYVDGFNIAGSSINPPIMDVERIEVLRGPQATYFGRNAIGGGISITSKKPENELSGSAMVDYSSFNTWDLEGVVNLPIVEDIFAVRINGKYSKSDGNIKNINPLGGGNDSEYKYAKISFRLTPSENLTIDLTGTYADEQVGMREGVPSGVFSAFAGDVLFASFPDRDGDGRADPAIDGIGFFPENRNRANFNSPQEVGTDFKYVVGTVQYDMETISFKSITGYVESDFFLRGDIDGGSRDFFNEFRTVPRNSFSQEFRVQNTDDGPILWNIGFLYAKDNGKSENRTFVGDEEPFGIPSGGAIDSSDENGKKTNWSVFGQVDWSVTEKLTLSVGGRYSSEKVETVIEGFSGATITDVSLNKTFTDFSPRIAANYAVSEDMNIYATVSKGFKSGGVQVSPFPGAESFAPETLWNYEVGLKADFLDNRVRMNMAAFYMNWTDLQTAFQQAGTDSEGNLTLFGGIDNAEKATSKGFELSATALVSENLVVNLSIGYLEAEYDIFTAFIQGQNRILDGFTIPNSPKWTASADAEYTFDITDDIDSYVRGEWTYRDSIHSTNEGIINGNGFPWRVPSYDFVNLRWGVNFNEFSVVGYVENLFDSVYYTNAFQKAFSGGVHIEPSFRRFGIRLKYNFK